MEVNWLTFGLRLTATAFFVLLNGFFVAAEFAFVKVRASQFEAPAAAGSRSARVARHIHAHLNRYLSACQLGITVASLILGWLAEPAIAELLIAGAHSLGWQSVGDSSWLHVAALAIALTIITFLHMTIGEQAPKLWAIHRAERAALLSAYPLRIFTAVFLPAIWLINSVSNAMVRLAGLTAEEMHESSATVAELRHILSTSAQAGHITPRQRLFTENILGMMDREVRHLMVPRVDVAFLSLRSSLEDNLRKIKQSGHSRLPLCRTDLDAVTGIVHARDVMGALVTGETLDLSKIARRPVFVPDTQPIPQLIVTLQSQRSHCAVVEDEHGTVVGLAFLEDALEEIVGTIADEFDVEVRLVKEVGPGVFEVAGSLSLPEAARLLGDVDLGDEADTIGGYLVAHLGRFPKQGDQLRIDGHRATVLQVSRRRVAKLRLETETDEPAAT